MKYITQAFKEKNIKQKDVIKDLGVPQSYASALMNGKKPIGKAMADKLNSLYGFDKALLLTEEDSNIVSEQKVEYTKKPEVEYTPNMYIVPLRAWGGFLAGYERRVFDLEKIPFPLVKGECFAFEIGGFSMLKEYKPGDYFIGSLIEGFDWLIKGRDYVFQTINGLILKRFVKIEDDLCYMESINEEYNPVDPMPLKEIKALYQREGVYNK